jgi:hypothetical protein
MTTVKGKKDEEKNIKEPLLGDKKERKDGLNPAVDEKEVIEALYDDFKEANKGFWLWFLIAILFISLLLLVGTVYAINLDDAQDCSGLLYILWCAVFMHAVNVIVCLIGLCSLEKYVCGNNACCGYVLFLLVCIIAMQVSYFNA